MLGLLELSKIVQHFCYATKTNKSVNEYELLPVEFVVEVEAGDRGGCSEGRRGLTLIGRSHRLL